MPAHGGQQRVGLGPYTRAVEIGAFVCLVGYFGMAVALITLLPANNDEATYASPAVTLLRTGRFGSALYEPKGSYLEGIDQITYFALPGHPLTSIPLLVVFDAPLVALRAKSLLFMIGALLLLFRLLKRFELPRPYPLLAVALVCLNRNWVQVSVIARPDAQAFFFGLAGSYLFATGIRQRKSVVAAAGGVLIALAVTTHVNGLVFGFFCLAVGVRELRANVGNVSTYIGGLAALLVMSAYGLFTRLYPDYFEAQMGWNATAWNRAYAWVHPFAALWREIQRWAYSTNSRNMVQQGAYAVISAINLCALFIVAAPRPRFSSALQLAVATYTAAAVVTFTFVNNISSTDYFFYRSLVTDICVVAVLAWLSSRGATKVTALWTAAVILLFAFHLSKDAVFLRSALHDARDYDALERAARANLKSDDFVMGDDQHAFTYGFSPRYLVDRTYGFYSGRRPTLVVLAREEGAPHPTLVTAGLGGACVGKRDYLEFIGPTLAERFDRDLSRLCAYWDELARNSKTVHRGGKYDLVRIQPGAR